MNISPVEVLKDNKDFERGNGQRARGGGEEIFKKCNLKRFFWWLEWRINEFEGFMKTKLLGEMMTYVNIFAKYFVNHSLRDYA